MSKKMKKNIIIFSIIILIIVTIAVIAINLNSENRKESTMAQINIKNVKRIGETAEEGLSFNVVDFGANGEDEGDDTTSIQNALNKAKDEIINNTNREIEVVIPEGTYYISSPLRIFSNTKMLLNENATIFNKYGNDVMLVAHHINEDENVCSGSGCTHVGYTQWHNITVEGGIWNCNNNSTAMHGALRFRHGEGLTLKNLVLLNSSGHTINPSASKTVLIDGVTIKDQISTPEKVDFANEVIHLDSSANGEETSYPVDGTPMEDVTIQNCTFENVLTAIGCHSIYRVASDIGASPNQKNYLEKLSNNIKILNNKFINIKYYAINAIAFRNMTIAGNTAVGKNTENKFSDKEEAWAFIHTRNCTGDTVVISDDISNGGNKVENFEYDLVRYRYNLQRDEINNNLQISGGSETTGFFRVYYDANGAEGEMEYTQQEMVTKPSGVTLPDATFVNKGYKVNEWNVEFHLAQNSEQCANCSNEGYLQKSDLKWHHSYFDLTAQWVERKGDINKDDKVDLIDLLILRRFISMKNTQRHLDDWNLTEDEQKRADLNGDNEINLKDVLILRRYIAASKSETISRKSSGMVRYIKEGLKSPSFNFCEINVAVFAFQLLFLQYLGVYHIIFFLFLFQAQFSQCFL